MSHSVHVVTAAPGAVRCSLVKLTVAATPPAVGEIPTMLAAVSVVVPYPRAKFAAVSSARRDGTSSRS